MLYRIIASLCLLLATTSNCQAQAQAAERSIAEIRFNDNSVVRMTMLQDAIDVQTKYGKLTIPTSDIRKIEFGLHIAPDAEKSIASAIKRLSSEVFKERDAASKELISFEHLSYQALKRVANGHDNESAHRAAAIVKNIEGRISADLLKLRDDDTIHTAEFTIIGKITSHTIKANSPHFGDASLKLSELRAVHLRQRAISAECVIDAAKYGSSLDQWYDTCVICDAAQKLTIDGNGQVDLWPSGPNQYLAKPKGYNTAGKGGQFMAGALIAKIGENGKAFYIGDNFEGKAPEEGKLYLQIVPSPWNNASTGNYKVAIKTGK